MERSACNLTERISSANSKLLLKLHNFPFQLSNRVLGELEENGRERGREREREGEGERERGRERVREGGEGEREITSKLVRLSKLTDQVPEPVQMLTLIHLVFVGE